MNKYLSKIIDRHASNMAIVRPRERSRYEPSSAMRPDIPDQSDPVAASNYGKSQIKPMPSEHLKTHTDLSTPNVPYRSNIELNEHVVTNHSTTKQKPIEVPSIASNVRMEIKTDQGLKEDVADKFKEDYAQKKVNSMLEAITESKNILADTATESTKPSPTIINRIEESKKVLLKENLLGKDHYEVPSVMSTGYEERSEESEATDTFQQLSINHKNEIKQELISRLQIKNSDHYGIQVDQSVQNTQVSGPTVKVQIGRIDIKAIKQPESPKKRSVKSNAMNSGMSLDQFLQKRAKK